MERLWRGGGGRVREKGSGRESQEWKQGRGTGNKNGNEKNRMEGGEREE